MQVNAQISGTPSICSARAIALLFSLRFPLYRSRLIKLEGVELQETCNEHGFRIVKPILIQNSGAYTAALPILTKRLDVARKAASVNCHYYDALQSQQ